MISRWFKKLAFPFSSQFRLSKELYKVMSPLDCEQSYFSPHARKAKEKLCKLEIKVNEEGSLSFSFPLRPHISRVAASSLA